ncbi:hypothetical protein N7523_003956 [Penicillium sp. IBT 18751x]|nr:hypothetical protein N7523_003956 [Penicillium sp. IBT 18751x]
MAETKLQILSDLHLEAPSAYDVFQALVGDIGYIKDDGFFHFLRKQLDHFQIVFLVLGNHEPYHIDWTEAKSKIEQFKASVMPHEGEEKLGQLVLLDKTGYDLSPTLSILGCTLFSRVIPEQEGSVSFGLNDFYYIGDWSIEAHCEAHRADLDWLNHEIKSISLLEPERKVVVLTHYCPSTSDEVVNPLHKNSKISSGFMTDLSSEECWNGGVVKLWAFGHTHFSCDFQDAGNGIRLVSNQRGYYFSQSTGFDCAKIVEI